MTLWDDTHTDSVDNIDGTQWNAMVADQKTRSLSTHTHAEFALMPDADYYYVYKESSTYYAKNMKTSAIDYSGANFGALMNSVIGAITNGGLIKIGAGQFDIETSIIIGTKAIVIEGSGWCKEDPATPVTMLKTGAAVPSGAYAISFGSTRKTLYGAGIRNLELVNHASNVLCIGGIDLYSTVNCFIDNCYISGFKSGSPTKMNAVSIRGYTDDALGGMNNRVTNCYIYQPDNGILLGPNANNNYIANNLIEGDATLDHSNGVKMDGTGASIASPLGCTIIANTIKNFAVNTPNRGVWVTAGSNSSGRHTFIGNVFSNNFNNVEITGGTDIGECTFVGNIFGTPAGAGAKAVDGGNVKSYYYNNKNYLTDNWGASTGTGSQQTIAHGLGATPTGVTLTQNASAILALYLSAAADATNIYVLCTNAKEYYWNAYL